MEGTSRLIGFLDECGDHSLIRVDPEFPLFVLALAVVERNDYIESIIPSLGKLKLRYWDHEGINLHSRDIRKSIGKCSFLMDRIKRPRFMQEIAALMETLSFTLFVTVINKRLHLQEYGAVADNPYKVALTATMRRLELFLNGRNELQLPVIAEARGKREDDDLARAFARDLSKRNSTRSAHGLSPLDCALTFCSKEDNVAGIQIADLCAYPCARHVIDPERSNAAFEIVKGHFYCGEVQGWEVL